VLGIREAGVQGDSEVLSGGRGRECGRFQRNRDREIRGGGGGGKEKEVRFGEVEFEVMRVHPGGNSRQTGRDTGGDGGVRGGEGEENLSIISIEMV
jgi:hypothetical protein